jgi:hypothetical protein
MSGKLKVDYASFVDWDEDCHGPMDSRSNRREYPENFKWTCCGEDGRSEGCQDNEHIPQRAPKRRRWNALSSTIFLILTNLVTVVVQVCFRLHIDSHCKFALPNCRETSQRIELEMRRHSHDILWGVICFFVDVSVNLFLSYLCWIFRSRWILPSYSISRFRLWLRCYTRLALVWILCCETFFPYSGTHWSSYDFELQRQASR